MRIERHRAALHRRELSRPFRLALADGILRAGQTVFDYGCGHGDDLRELAELGYTCNGWDPALRPTTARIESDVVNLGFVVNVIEDADERAQVLRSAWALAHQVLVVAARVKQELRGVGGEDFADGLVTKRGTFQRFFDHGELGQWIESSLGATALSAAPGVYYVFRSDAEREAFAAARVRRPRVGLRVVSATELFERHASILQPLVDFLAARGRLPGPDEFAATQEIAGALGSIPRAGRIIKAAVGAEAWERAELERSEDLLVYLALARFQRRPPFGSLSRDLQLDVRAFFRSYERASILADQILLSVGKPDLIDRACQGSAVGKLTPSALYVHESALQDVPPLLRVYEGCARAFIGTVEGANVVKLGRRDPSISYLVYPRFDEDAHPALSRSVLVNLARQRVDARDYTASTNPPILHRKEEFVPMTHPLRPRFAKLTAQEERAGLYESTNDIGTHAGWQKALESRGVQIRGHTVRRTRSV